MAQVNKLRKAKSLFSTTLSTGIGTGTSDTITPNSVTGLATDTEVTLTIDRIDSGGTATPSLMERITGTISGGNLINYTRAVEGTEQAHASGAVVEYIWNADDWNDHVDHHLVEHNDAGTHKETALDSMIAGTEAQGDIIYHNGTIWTRLAKGTDGQVLTLASSVPSWAAITTTGDGWVAAGVTWTYAAADDPTFTFTIAGVDLTTTYYAGMKVKLTQTTAKYFIITKVAFSTDTTVTIYGGTDYDLANAAITSPYYSTAKAPAGFPMSPNKWMVETTDTSLRQQATPTQNTWYNPNSQTISIPIGSWHVSYQAMGYTYESSTGSIDVWSTLSTANNSESDVDFTCRGYLTSLGAAQDASPFMARNKFLDLTSKTSYYLNCKTSYANIDAIGFHNDNAKLIIRALCAYL